MLKSIQVLTSIIVLAVLFLAGCGDNNSSSPTVITSSSETSSVEGQLVAETGTVSARLTQDLEQGAFVSSSSVYPLSGVTVELLQDGTVVATTLSDEYGRFRFVELEPGEYDVRVFSPTGAVVHYHITVTAAQTLSVYGRVMSDECYWEQEPGPHWDDMPHGPHWGAGFQGASPGPGYWYDGQQWCEPQGTGPYHGGH